MSSQSTTLRITLIGLFSLAIAMGIGRFAFTPLLPMMQADGLVGISDGGVLASVHFLGYWLGAVFAPGLSRRPKFTLRLSLIAVAACTLGMGLTDNLGLWLIYRWICGVFSATTMVLISNYYVNHLAKEGRNDLQGWVFAGVGVGIAGAGLATLALMIVGIGSAHSWQLIGAVTVVGVLVVCWRVGAEVPNRALVAARRSGQRTPLIWRNVLAYGVTGLGYVIPATYLPIMARETIDSPIVFGWSWPIFGLAAFLSTLLVASFRKRFSNRRIWAVGQVVMAFGLILPVIQPHIAAIMAAGICVGGTFMIITMMGMMEAHRLAPADDVMRHIAVMTAAFASGQIIGPVFAGFVHDLSGSFTPVLLITAAPLLATAINLVPRRD